jgi:hypothetical protein
LRSKLSGEIPRSKIGIEAGSAIQINKRLYPMV